MSKIYAQLQQVQLNLIAPKNEFNSFGNYSYRSAEGILEAVKPLLAENELVLTLSDDIVFGNDAYIKAIAKVTNLEGESIEVTAYAREANELKGMQPSQITGSTSSYARKYALNGLFCIDDTKDADATNEYGKNQQGSGKDKPTTNKPTQKNVTKGGEVKFYCADDGIEISEKIANYSKSKYGRALCMSCQAKVK